MNTLASVAKSIYLHTNMIFEKVVANPGVVGGTLGGLTDVTITTAAQGDVLYYDGSGWVNLATGTAGTPLLAGGAGADPYYSTTIVVDAINPNGTTLTVNDNLAVTGTASVEGAFSTSSTSEFGDDVSVEGGIIISVGNRLQTDTIAETTSAAGVTIDGVLIKDSVVATDTINEKTGSSGVTVEGVLIKDSIVSTDNITELSSATGVTIDGVLLKDGGITTSAASVFAGNLDVGGELTSEGAVTLGTGELSGMETGSTVHVNPDHSGATDTRTGLGAYDPNRPFSTIQAAITAASTGDHIVIHGTSYTENLTITGKSLTMASATGRVSIGGSITFAATASESLDIYEIDVINTGTAIAMTSGANAIVSLWDASANSLSGAAFSQALAGQDIYLYRGSSAISTTSTSVTGSLNVLQESSYQGNAAGTGSFRIGQGAQINGTITTSTVSYTSSFKHYFDEVVTDTISEETAGSGVAVDGVKCKDSKVITAVTNVTGTTYTTLATDNVVLVDDDTAGAAVTVTLLAAATAGDGHRIDIKKLGSTGNVVIDANGAELIDGALTQTLTTQYENITLICDGSSWHIL